MKTLTTTTLGCLLLLFPLLGSGHLVAGSEPDRSYHLPVIDSLSDHPYGDIRAVMLEKRSEFSCRAGENRRLTTHSLGNHAAYGMTLLKAAQDAAPHVLFVGGTLVTIAVREVLLEGDLSVVFVGTTERV